MKILLRRTLIAFGGLLVLLVLFHLVENWRGNRAWAAWQKGRVAAGDRFDRAGYAPPVIPDAENFANAPRVAAAIQGTQPLLALPANWPEGRGAEWREGRVIDLEPFRAAFPGGDLKKGLEAYKETLDDVVKAAQRPGCRVPIDYARFPDFEIPSLSGFRAAARMLQLRGLVALREGRVDAAFQDVDALLRMVQHFEQEPILLCQLLRMSLAGIALQPTWEGLETHAWTETQLHSIQGRLAKVDFLTSMDRSWKSEQAGMSALYLKVAREAPWEWTAYPKAFFESSRPGRWMSLGRHLAIPRGWILQNAIHSARAIQIVRDPLDLPNHRIDLRRQDAAQAVQAKQRRTPYTILATNALPALAAQNLRAARLQVNFTQAAIACGLERYYKAKGAYPEQLSELKVSVPTDVIDGQPLRYHRNQAGGYVLYSLGWNGTDEGGQARPGSEPDREDDWVWTIQGQSTLRTKAPSNKK